MFSKTKKIIIFFFFFIPRTESFSADFVSFISCAGVYFKIAQDNWPYVQKVASCIVNTCKSLTPNDSFLCYKLNDPIDDIKNLEIKNDIPPENFLKLDFVSSKLHFYIRMLEKQLFSLIERSDNEIQLINHDNFYSEFADQNYAIEIDISKIGNKYFKLDAIPFKSKEDKSLEISKFLNKIFPEKTNFSEAFLEIIKIAESKDTFCEWTIENTDRCVISLTDVSLLEKAVNLIKSKSENNNAVKINNNALNMRKQSIVQVASIPNLNKESNKNYLKSKNNYSDAGLHHEEIKLEIQPTIKINQNEDINSKFFLKNNSNKSSDLEEDNNDFYLSSGQENESDETAGSDENDEKENYKEYLKKMHQMNKVINEEERKEIFAEVLIIISKRNFETFE